MLHLPLSSIDFLLKKMDIVPNVISPAIRMKNLFLFRQPYMSDEAKADPCDYLKNIGYLMEDGDITDELKEALKIILCPEKCYIADLFSEEKRKSIIYVFKGSKTLRIELIDFLFVISNDSFEAMARNEIFHMVGCVAADKKATMYSEVLVNNHSHSVAVKNQDDKLLAVVSEIKLLKTGGGKKISQKLYKYDNDSHGIVSIAETACYESATGTDGLVKVIINNLKTLFSKENILKTVITYIASFGVSILLQVLFPISLRIGNSVILQTFFSYLTYVLLTQLVVNVTYNIRKGETVKRIKDTIYAVKGFLTGKYSDVKSHILCGAISIILLALAILYFPWQFSLALGITFITAAIAGNNSRLLMYKRKITKKYLDLGRGSGLIIMGFALLLGCFIGIVAFTKPQDRVDNDKTRNDSYINNSVEKEDNKLINDLVEDTYRYDANDVHSEDESDYEELTNVQLFFKEYGDIPGPSVSELDAGYYYAMASMYMDVFDFDTVKYFFTDTSDEDIYSWFNKGHGDLYEMEYITYVPNIVSIAEPYAEIGIYKFDIPDRAKTIDEASWDEPVYITMKYTAQGYRMCINEISQEVLEDARNKNTRTHQGNFYASLGHAYKNCDYPFNIMDYPFCVPGLFYYEVVEYYLDNNDTLHLSLYLSNASDRTVSIEGFESKIEDYAYSFGYIAEIDIDLDYEIASGGFDLLDITVDANDLATTNIEHLEAEYYTLKYTLQ